jgi:alpha-aminoadipic semialdehyde synthase
MSLRIGLRKEDKNEWERRVVLTPQDAGRLRASGLSIVAESFPRRSYPDRSYVDAGVPVVESVADCDLILGVKEMPKGYFREGGAYMFFSHTIKGQPYNMAMLAELVEKKCTLLDYELVTDDEGRRLIFFSYHAGLVGMTDSLWMLGRRLQALGHESPLLELQPAHAYRDLDALKAAVAQVGERIADEGLPAAMGPWTVGILGYGRVAQGAQEILQLLPHVKVSPEELPRWCAANAGRNRDLGMVVYREEHLVERTDGSAFELQDYYQNPGNYRAIFAPHLPYLSLLVNAIYWDKRYPRFADADTLRALFASPQAPKLLAVGDITCDMDGSLACTIKETGPGDPVYLYQPEDRSIRMGFEGSGLEVLAVGNLPCELPVEASAHFSQALSPFLPHLAGADLGAAFEEAGLPGPMERATILWRGQFTPHCAHMAKYLD